MSVSKFSIHDLSRVDRIKKKDYPRFNMPFECGIDFGLKKSGNQDFLQKKFLILDKEPYRYKSIISDISGNDIRVHKDDPEQIIKVVRDWFKLLSPGVPWYRKIWLAYTEFDFDYEQILTENNLDPKDIYSLTFSDIIDYMSAWITEYKAIQTR